MPPGSAHCSKNGSRVRRTSGSHTIGTPERSGRRAKITVDTARPKPASSPVLAPALVALVLVLVLVLVVMDAPLGSDGG
jgi:hypothetical protein